jgi:hypothetical protein
LKIGESIDYRCEDRKKELASYEAKLVSFAKSCLPLSETLNITQKTKRTIQPGHAFEDTAFQL